MRHWLIVLSGLAALATSNGPARAHRVDPQLGTILSEVSSLPGATGVAIARLGDGAPALIAGHEPDRDIAIASAFKLFVLAELSRQVQAGQRRWSDIVHVDRRLVRDGALANAPEGSPVTLRTLAAMMISTSDNAATDILMRAIGRENVEAMMERIGIAAAARNRPLISTLELFTIKTGPDAAVRAWREAGEAERRRLLATTYANLDPSRVNGGRFTGYPLHIQSVEWFASPMDLVRTMDWLFRNGDDEARAILAINPSFPGQLRPDFPYVGYKGGSEPGVVNLTWLIRSRAGNWYVVSAGWNNVAAPISERRLAQLMIGAIQQLR